MTHPYPIKASPSLKLHYPQLHSRKGAYKVVMQIHMQSCTHIRLCTHPQALLCISTCNPAPIYAYALTLKAMDDVALGTKDMGVEAYPPYIPPPLEKLFQEAEEEKIPLWSQEEGPHSLPQGRQEAPTKNSCFSHCCCPGEGRIS
ncbi:hypothetical protein L195_g007265 [Trifolium pratense]|uniref:Uncharacterized protein n=1 Tax=Trifolium pratense TaxID=57577 RepID=A0A2K3P5W4_TRIPR|nr:hypothetical protein L195_g007265 [Trifolium pratense]